MVRCNYLDARTLQSWLRVAQKSAVERNNKLVIWLSVCLLCTAEGRRYLTVATRMCCYCCYDASEESVMVHVLDDKGRMAARAKMACLVVVKESVCMY